MSSDDRLGALDEVLDSVLADPPHQAGLLGSIVDKVTGGPARDRAALPVDLFTVVDALASSPPLRRALTDPSMPEDNRRRLAHGLFDGRVGELATEVVAQGATLRWSGGQVFVAALERQAVRAQLISAEDTSSLGETEDELFRFARLVEGDSGLRNALADRAVPLAGRQDLVRQLLEGNATPATVALAQRAVAARERTFGHTIEGYVTLAAAQQKRVVATVRVAQPLSEEQRERLRVALARQTGREVTIQVIVDEQLLGGVRVELGDEVIEGTVAGRLQEARRLFT